MTGEMRIPEEVFNLAMLLVVGMLLPEFSNSFTKHFPQHDLFIKILLMLWIAALAAVCIRVVIASVAALIKLFI